MSVGRRGTGEVGFGVRGTTLFFTIFFFCTSGPLYAASADDLIRDLDVTGGGDIRYSAAESLGRVLADEVSQTHVNADVPRIVDALIATIKNDPQSVVRWEAINSLCSVSWNDDGNSRTNVKPYVPRIVETFIATIKNDSDQFVRDRAICLFRFREYPNFNNSLVADVLIGLLQDADTEKRREAIRDLGYQVTPTHNYALHDVQLSRVVEAVAPLLKDQIAFVRIDAARTLSAVNKNYRPKDGLRYAAKSRADAFLVDALPDNNLEVRVNVAVALGEMGDPRAFDPLVDCLTNPDFQKLGEISTYEFDIMVDGLPSDTAQHAVIMALASLAERADKNAVGRAAPTLLPFLQDWTDGPSILKVLGRSGWKPVSQEDKVHYWIARRDRKLLTQNWQQTREILVADMRSSEPMIWRNALNAGIGIGNDDFIVDALAVLDEAGKAGMADAFLNSRDPKLEEAAKSWARHHGYTVRSTYGFPDVQWGKM